MSRKQVSRYHPRAGENFFDLALHDPGCFSRLRPTLILLMLLAGSSSPVYSDGTLYSVLPSLTLLATSPQQHAVLMQPDRQLLTLGMADELGDSQAYIIEILADRIVLQQQALVPAHPPRLIWLYRAAAADQPSRIVTLDRIAPAQPLARQPDAMISSSPAAGEQD